ncbi:conserved hypothetical protein [Candidatus Roizmanbacteria bacterium]|nr:conserved hypothetical protein [Candidatus Roizmanbacteria bacterium]
MTTDWFKNFIEGLERIIDKPPYLLFVFIGAVFLVISLITRFSFEQIWIFFLYSVAGTIWRYAEKDIQGIDRNNKKLNSILRIIYHIGNIGLFLTLLHFLNFI